jgi:GT2 family glycosyltransferase
MTEDVKPVAPADIPGGLPTLAEALVWMAGRLAEEMLEAENLRRDGDTAEDETDRLRVLWRGDASSYPSEYWHWQHLSDLARIEHPEDFPVPVPPADGPLLSVVVPVYRPSLWYFRECVLSVVNQTYPNWELCLCDDGSGDPQLTAVIEEFASGDPRIRAVPAEENGGISRATNRALSAATGEFIVLLDHDDLLEPDALAEIAAVATGDDEVDIVYTDEDKLDPLGRPYQPSFKPDWDPDLLLSHPYLGHITAIRHSVIRQLGGFRPEYDGSQDFDMMLRATEVARRVVHIPKVLYHWRVVSGSAAGDTEAKPWAYAASRRAVEDALRRRGIDGVVEDAFLGGYHVRRAIEGAPTVSVIIPFRDQASLTRACLESLEASPGHPIAEFVLVDNGSTEPETRALRRELDRNGAVRVLESDGAFNWAALNNLAASTCATDLLLFMNNDIEASGDGWLRALVEEAQRPEVGAVGARLVYPDGSIQHAGVVYGTEAIVGHIFQGMQPSMRRGYGFWERVVRRYSAVTGACMLVRREVFEEVGGFDEMFPVAFNDIDFCLRLGRSGYRVLYTPHAELTHFESISRGLSGYSNDFQEFLSRWWDVIRQDDPCYNRNLSRFDPWCPLREPDEDRRWLELIGPMVPEQRRPSARPPSAAAAP